MKRRAPSVIGRLTSSIEGLKYLERAIEDALRSVGSATRLTETHAYVSANPANR